MFQIECLEFCGDSLFVGTSKGHLVHYQVEENHSNPLRISFNLTKVAEKPLSQVKDTKNLLSSHLF